MAKRASFLDGIQLTRGARYLLIASTAISLGYMLAGRGLQVQLEGALVATPGSLVHGLRLWQVVTSPLLEPQLISLLFQGFMLWTFLPTMERWWGTARFLRFALYTSIAGIAGGTLVGVLLGGDHARWPMTGLDPFVFGAILAFGVLYADHPVRFFGAIPMKGRQLAIGITAVVFVFIAIGQRWVEGAANASAMLLAWVMTSTRSSPKLLWLTWKQRRVRRKLGVVTGGKRDQRWLN